MRTRGAEATVRLGACAARSLLAVWLVLGCGSGTNPPGLDGAAPNTDVPALRDAAADAARELATADGVPDVVDSPDIATNCARPSAFLCPCATNADCQSGFCVQTAEGKRCTQSCLEDCPAGWDCAQVQTSPDVLYMCVPTHPTLCRPCRASQDCKGPFTGDDDHCVAYGPAAGRFCGGACTADPDCPEGYRCADVLLAEGGSRLQCVRASGAECPCTLASAGLATDCEAVNPLGRCRGTRTCYGGVLSGCDAPIPASETCNGLDDDCNGATDDGVADSAPLCALQEGVCTGATAQCRGTARWVCDELTYKARNPGYSKSEHDCDGVDNDCDGFTDEGWDATPTGCGEGACAGQGRLLCLAGRVADTCVARACDDGNPCNGGEACDPATGCSPGTPVPCDDADRCNGIETCDPATGFCAVGTPVACTALDACHLVGRCDALTGLCDRPQAPDGTACDDGDPRSGGDHCVNGTCVAEGCTCAGNGTCCDGCFARNEDAACSDGDACTTGERCATGACRGGTGTVCHAVDACHQAGTCDPVNGLCSNPPMPDGTACDDGNACTWSDSCRVGTCVGSQSSLCPASDGCHLDGACDPETGTCSIVAAPDGTGCNDRNECTQVDTCRAGACVGEAPVQCQALDACHLAGTCNAISGTCSNPPGPDDVPCDDGSACTRIDACSRGVCWGKAPILCEARDACHVAGTCDPASGACSDPPAPDGTPCSDGDSCTRTDSCVDGSCAGSDAVTCTPQDACHDAGACDPATGLCANPAGHDGDSCDDGNACTRSDNCAGGSCVGTDDVACAPLDTCHTVGACNPATGRCSDPARPDGVACDDADACTRTDACEAGVCVGRDVPTCTALDQCHVVGTCDPASGTCSQPATDEDTACDDEDACTSDDRCRTGPGGEVSCRGTPYSCDDGLACTRDACDGRGECSHGLLEGFCQVDGTCLAEGQADTANPCRTCQSSVATAATTPLPDGTVCGYLMECEAAVCETRVCPPGYVVVPAGEFDMGSPVDEAGRGDTETLHHVLFSRHLCLKATEVTQGEWKTLMRNNPSQSAVCGNDCPVESVSWWDAVAYCNALSQAESLSPCYHLKYCLGTPGSIESPYTCSIFTAPPFASCGYRLPTESEWEYAARAGTVTATYLSNLDPGALQCQGPNDPLDSIAWFGGNACEVAPDAACLGGAGCGPHPVGTLAPNDLGPYDILGNVDEWIGDRQADYPAGPVTDPRGGSVGWRGGAWNSPADQCRAAWRGSALPTSRSASVGFRPARTMPSAGTCGNPTPEGDPCDDENACTMDDRCHGAAGGPAACVGRPYLCDDQLACTTDTCDGSGGCSHVLLTSDYCLIDGICRNRGATQGGCKVCQPDQDSTGWTLRPDGTSCSIWAKCRAGVCTSDY